MLDDYPETRLAQKLFDDIPDHLQRAIYLMPGATRVDPKDPTRRKDYAATKADLLHLITSPWGKYEIQRVYNNHIQTATPTIAGAADTANQPPSSVCRMILFWSLSA